MKNSHDDDGASGSPLEPANPHSWITKDIVRAFLEERGVNMVCEVCKRETVQVLDAAEDDFTGSLPAYGRLNNGNFNTDKSIHMPVARLVCVNCGNMRLHSLYIIDMWKQLKATGFNGPIGQVVK